jgi:ribosome recycling factor
LTEDRRKDMVKQTKKIGEDAKVNIRNIRRDFNDIIKKAEKNSEISEDDSQFYQDEIQSLTDQFIVKVDEKATAKEKDLMTV